MATHPAPSTATDQDSNNSGISINELYHPVLEGESYTKLDDAQEAELRCARSGTGIRAGGGIDEGGENCAGEAENVAELSKLGCVERIERLCTELKVDAIPRSY